MNLLEIKIILCIVFIFIAYASVDPENVGVIFVLVALISIITVNIWDDIDFAFILL